MTVILESESPVVAITGYKCTNCAATDWDRGYGGPAPLALNCWQCGEGRTMAPHQQVEKSAGMIRLDHPFWDR